ncbi:MAG: hypothetical protein QOF76_3623 [Solirubrobacteraceae bacterium]|jgi:hypothetical protein|nr:hypothetical protein [Solirubrobacteraceae bacterium]
MDATRRTTHLRRVATTASLAALILVPAGQADAKKSHAKSPTISSVRPLNATVGDTLTIKGAHFKKGKATNSVGFKAAGESVVFVRSDLSTTKTMTVNVSPRLQQVMDGPTQFRLRILSRVFGKGYTSDKLSPMITPKETATPEPVASPTPISIVIPEGTATPTPVPEPTQPTKTLAHDCDFDGVEDPTTASDKDGDGLSNDLETKTLGTDANNCDTDADGISDGYEYRSAIDLNDDEYQSPNNSLPFPSGLPYPNPLSPTGKTDQNVDFDGDGLTMKEEFLLWLATTPANQRTLTDPADGSATPLSYSDGLQYSVSRRCPASDASAECGSGNAGRRVPSLTAAGYSKWTDFTNWLQTAGYATVSLHDKGSWFQHVDGRHPYSILDIDRSGAVDPDEQFTLDTDKDGYLSDDERDEDADGLSNIVESHTEMLPAYWNACYDKETPYLVVYDGTDMTKADTDKDGIRDGADDQDHDDIPNMMELSRARASRVLDTEDHVKGVTTGQGGGALCKPDFDLTNKDDGDQGTTNDGDQPFKDNHPDLYGQVNPFNPCLPDPDSRSCARYFADPPAPFDNSPNWWSLQ